MKTLCILLIVILCISCERLDDPLTVNNIIVDIDGNEYHSVSIGTQEWLVEDLRVLRLNDGTPIHKAVSKEEWISIDYPAYCICGDKILYNYYCVNTNMLAPKGYHIASDSEWKTLEIYLGMIASEADKICWRGDGIADMLKSTDFYVNNGIQDMYGFKACNTNGRNGYFGDFICGGYWWTSSRYDNNNAYMRGIDETSSGIYRGYTINNSGFCVRCIKNI
jgi:uncharacterized protein (TIGR02145 family)